MVRVPQIASRPVDMPAMQSPSVQPMQNFAPQQIGQMGQALEQAGQRAITVGDYLQDKINDSVAMQKFSNFRDRVQAAAINKEGGFLTTQGENAVKGYGAARKSIDDIFKEEYDGLENEVQRSIYQQQASLFKTEYVSRLDAHTFKEHKTFYVKELGRKAQGLWQDFANSVANPEGGSISPDALLDAATRSTQQLFSEQGVPLDSATANSDLEKLRDEALSGAITNLLDQENLSAAEAAMSKYEGMLSEPKRQDLRKVVQKAQSDRTAVQFAEGLRTQYPDDIAAQSDALTKAYTAAGSTMTDDAFKTAMGHLSARYNVEATAKARTSNAMLDEAINASIGTRAVTMEQQLGVAGVEKLRKAVVLDKFKQWWDSGQQYVTQGDYYQFFSQKSDAELAQMNPDTFAWEARGLLSPEHMKYALARIKVAKNQATPDDVRQVEFSKAIDYRFDNQSWYAGTMATIAGQRGGENAAMKQTLQRWKDNLSYAVRLELEKQSEQMRKESWPTRMEDAISKVDAPGKRVYVRNPLTGEDVLIPQLALSQDELKTAKVSAAGKTIPITEMVPTESFQEAATAGVTEFQRVSDAQQALLKKYPGSVPYDYAVKLGVPASYIQNLPAAMRPDGELSVGALVAYLQRRPTDPEMAVEGEAVLTEAQKEWLNGMPAWYGYPDRSMNDFDRWFQQQQRRGNSGESFLPNARFYRR